MDYGLEVEERLGQGVVVRRVFFKILNDRRFQRLCMLGLALAIGLVLLAWKMGVDLEKVRAVWLTVRLFLAMHPWWLFAALVILPGLPVPTSALVFTAGAVWHDDPLWAMTVVMSAMTLNLCWTYWLAARPGRSLVERWILSGRYEIPELPKGNDVKLILMLRFFPGMPFFVQNYLLGFFRVPFRIYLPVSVLSSSVIAAGVVLTAAGIGDGNLVPLIAGVGVLVAAAVAVKMVRRGK